MTTNENFTFFMKQIFILLPSIGEKFGKTLPALQNVIHIH